MDITITDASDPRLADYARLTDPQFRIRDEVQRGYFIVESAEPLRTALDVIEPERVRSVLITPERHDALREALAPVADRVLLASRDVVREIVGFNLHRGVLASIDRVAVPTLDTVLSTARLIAVAEGVNDHENLGALFRNAAALGVDGVVLDPTCADPLYRRSVRVSIGHVLTVPWTRAERWPDALGTIRRAGFTMAALTPAADAVPIDQLASRYRAPIALLIGAEGPGLSEAALAAADVRARIPMRPGVDSLNVATAAAIAFWECLRP